MQSAAAAAAAADDGDGVAADGGGELQRTLMTDERCSRTYVRRFHELMITSRLLMLFSKLPKTKQKTFLNDMNTPMCGFVKILNTI